MTAMGGQLRPHRIDGADREDKVRGVHASLNPQRVSDLPLTEDERATLLERVEEMRIEIESAPAYTGAL